MKAVKDATCEKALYLTETTFIFLRNLRFSQWCCWGLSSFATWHESGFRSFEGMLESKCTTKNHHIPEDLNTHAYIYRVSQEERTKFRECVPYVKLYRYNPKHLYPKLNGYGDNGQRSLKLWQLLHTYWLPDSYWNWQEYVVSVMLISVLNIKVTCEWHEAI